MRVLDVGCGPGTVTVGLAELVGPQGSVLGVDASAEVVELARADAAATNVRFDVQDVMHLDLPDGAFDVAHAHQVLQHLPDPVAALAQMRRVTRAGGLVAVREADYAAMTWFPVSEGLDRWRSLYRQVARRHGAEPDAARRLTGWARRAGFDDVTASASAWCFATQQDRQWWSGLQADRITRSDMAAHAVAASLAGEADLQEMASAWRAWADSPDGWFAVLHGEILCRVNEG